ncbi:hypothetical protein HDV62DRAFT_211429 [Trichoderma sp. SZMC 28011]
MPAQVRTLQLAFDIFLFFPSPVWPGWALIAESDLPSYVSIDMDSTFLLMENSESAKPSRCCVVLMEKIALQFGGWFGEPALLHDIVCHSITFKRRPHKQKANVIHM